MLTFDSTSSLLNYVPSCSTGFETGASASAGIKVKGQKLSRHICIMQINRKSTKLSLAGEGGLFSDNMFGGTELYIKRDSLLASEAFLLIWS